MTNKVNEQMSLSYSNPANNYGSNNLRDLILVLHESGKEPETIYNVLNMIGVEKQKAYEAIEMYIPKKIQDQKMEIKEKVESLSEDMTMMTGPGKAKMKKKDAEVKEMTALDMLPTKKAKKVVEQELNLPGRISLIKAIAENMPANYQTSAIKTIAEKYFQLSNTPGNVHSVLAKNFINELNQYSWIDQIATVVNELADSIKNNSVSISLNETYLKLKSSNRNAYFSKAITEMEDMLNLTESELIETGSYKLSAHSWIPEVKSVINQINYIKGDLNENTTHLIVKKYSPVIEHEGGHIFNLHGTSYLVKDNQISIVDPKQVAAQYLTLIAVEENFKFSENKMTYRKGNHTYEISLNENGKTLTLDGRELLFKESAQLKNLLMSTANFSVNELYQIDMIVEAYQNAEKFVELDFVQSIQPRNARGVVANIMRIGENVYVNKINTSMNLNEFAKAETATKAVEIIKEFVGYDISNSVQDLLEEDVKTIKIVESKKNDLLDKISFLKEQKSMLSNQDMAIETIAEANKLITEEIEKFQKEFNSIL
jgi:hypothetical protein